jgi:hypothetical protein
LPREHLPCSHGSRERFSRSRFQTPFIHPRHLVSFIVAVPLFVRIHKRRHVILWWSEETVRSLIYFTTILASRVPLRIVELVQNG